MLRIVEIEKIEEWKSLDPLTILHENPEGITIQFAKVEEKFEVRVVFPEGSIYVLFSGQSKKEMNRKYQKTIKRLTKGDFIVITGAMKAKLGGVDNTTEEKE
jgi:hypothetical protein